MTRRGAYRTSHIDQTGAGLGTIAQRRALGQQPAGAWGAERLSRDEAWTFLQAQGWGAIYAVVHVHGHLVQRQRGSGGRGVLRLWYVYDVRTWDVLWSSAKVELGRVVADVMRYTSRGHALTRKPMPAFVQAVLVSKGKRRPRVTRRWQP